MVGNLIYLSMVEKETNVFEKGNSQGLLHKEETKFKEFGGNVLNSSWFIKQSIKILMKIKEFKYITKTEGSFILAISIIWNTF